MKQLKHLRQTLWRALLCLTVVVGFAAPGWARDLYLVGANYGGWNIDQNYKMSQSGDVYTITVDNLSGEWKIRDGSKQSDGQWDYSFGQQKDTAPTLGVETEVSYQSSENFKLSNNGKTRITLNVYDTANNKAKIKVENADTPTVSTDLYIGGSFQNGSWTNPTKLTYADGAYTDFEITTTGGNQQFRFYTSNTNTSSSTVWMGANGSTKQFTDDDLNGTKTFTTTYQSSNPYQFKDAGTYILKVSSYDSNTKVVTFTVRKKDGGSGDVTNTEYEYYLLRSRDWNNPEKLEFKNGVATLTRDMNANGEFGIRVNKKSDGSQVGWYIANEGKAIAAGKNTYPLVIGNNVNIKLPNKGGEYKFVITLDGNNLPKDITIITPEIEEELPLLYIGGSYKGGNWEKPALITRSLSAGKYNDYKIVVTKAGQEFRFYDKDMNKIGPDVNDYWLVKVKDHCNGSYELNAVSKDKVFKFEERGTYTISIKEYDEAKKTVKFTMTYAELEKHLYLGADFKGNLDAPDLQIDNNGKFNKVRFSKYSNDEGKFRFSLYETDDANDWIAPDNNADLDINLSISQAKGEYSANKGIQTFVVKNNGIYELQVTEWNDYQVKFTLNYIQEVENDTPYYFVGDMNDWFSHEFEDPTAPQGASMTKFMNERDAWKFRKVKEGEVVPKGVTTDWYVFDKFPDNQLSGQFQITSGGKHIWNDKDHKITGTEVYGHPTALDDKNMWTNNDATLKEYLGKRITDAMIKGEESLQSAGHGIQRRVDYDSSFPNFHMECNAVADAKIYFKPGDTGANSDMIISGTPRHFFVFYANTKSADGDDEIVAQINYGKPNTNNYFLPGVRYNNTPIKNYAEGNCGNPTNKHMYADGTPFRKVEQFKKNDAETPGELKNYLKGLGLDQVIADKIVDEGMLPNGRKVDSFEHLYIARIPAGFENPAGWKYTLSLPKALNRDDRQKPIAIACNHIYIMPTINGVSVHINDDEFMQKDNYIINKEGEKVYMRDMDALYYYRVYYSTPSADGNNYEIKIVDHMPGNVVRQEYTAYKSKTDARKPTLQETGYKREFGWKQLNAYTSPEMVNKTITQEQWNNGEKGWNIKEGNLSGKDEVDSKWHICWVESTDRLRRQRIPKEYSNAYIQIFACYFDKANPESPSNRASKKAARAAEVPTIATAEEYPMIEALQNADHYSIEPGELSFDNDKYHHPLQGNHLYYVLDSNAHVWTGVEEIEDDLIVDAEDVNVNATPVYYNLQGVRVAEPTKGIFIEVRGNKSRKVMY